MRLGITLFLVLALFGCAKEGRHFESDEAIKSWFAVNGTKLEEVVSILVANPGIDRVETEPPVDAKMKSGSDGTTESIRHSLDSLNLILVYAAYDHSQSPPALIKVSFLIERWGIAISGGGVAVTWFTDKAVGISKRVSCNELVPINKANWYIEKLSSESKCR